MKSTASCFFIFFVCINLSARQAPDSVGHLLLVTKNDTIKVRLLNTISGGFVETKPDSALFYGNQALELSRKIDYTKGEISALLNTSAGFSLTGNYSKALENALDALKKSETLNNDRLLADSYFQIALCYTVQEDHKTSIPYGLKTIGLFQKLHDSINMATSLINTGVSYNELNMLDSARQCFNKALELSLRMRDENNVSAIYLNLGIISLKMKQYELGLSYCRLSLPYFKTANNPLFLSSIYYFMGYLFDSSSHRDSAFYYARLAYHYAKEMGSPQLLIFSSTQLASFFKKSKRLDSAFVYQEMAMNAKNSLTNQQKQKQVQALTFNEQLRQMDIAKQKEQEAAVRKRNLELAAIAIFIPLFLFAVMMLGRRKVKSRTVEFLGVLALLFLFEFIVLFAHPYIGHWTHESPVWMLLILVAVAAILIPLHHRSEAWIKKKLATKSEIRLQSESLQT